MIDFIDVCDGTRDAVERSMNKLNLKYGELVKIKNMSDELDGKTVRVIGLSSRNVLDTYIVSWDHVETMPDFGEYEAFCAWEACLERV